MTAVESLNALIVSLDDLLSNSEFINGLPGEDQSFLDTCWDFFVRIEEDLTGVSAPEEDPTLWRTQQDAETD